MRIAKEILSKVSSHIGGEDGSMIVDYLKGKENISEFKIEKDTGIEIHTVRSILYKLNGEHLVTYIRKKDPVKGWYISYWTINPKRFKEVYEKLQYERVDKLKEKLHKEQEYRDGLYICPNLCTRMPFDVAMENSFKCLECGSVLNQQDNSRTIENLKGMIAELEVVA